MTQPAPERCGATVFSGSPARQIGMISGVFRMDDALSAALGRELDKGLDLDCAVAHHASRSA